ncbi:rhodanese-like domain-containing protein [Brumimicrobium aurantiacum]|uniref:Rhodanese-like domain-containing protein n=1 Tax=Brumimicrobium aurantiacum TaxID=1737063 RepID=A0A3E1F204_9FLAO|nr:rhodanese-like domain-containing protein [Brumimicrobium aurantiacum]RFC55858.1 rhodanese-like domain-containing protein [Brumimicrobium aurantiacum]
MKTTLLLILGILLTFASSVFGQDIASERHERVDKTEFKEAIESGDFILLDIRSVEEYQESTIEGSKLVEFNNGDLDHVFSRLPKAQKYLIFSNNGVRSKVALTRMKELGFTYVLELDTGLSNWP